MCAQPDLAATDIDKDEYLMLFAALLKEHVPLGPYQLFQKKATEFSLLKDPTFYWCAHVSFVHISFVVINKIADFRWFSRPLECKVRLQPCQHIDSTNGKDCAISAASIGGTLEF